MARGPKHHLKRIRAPKSWMLSKLGGIWATRPSQGPHKLRESIPLSIALRHRLNVALTGPEVLKIVNDKEAYIRVDGKIRRDRAYPLGLMDTITIDKSGDNYRVLYDEKGRFILKPVEAKEAKYKLLRVKSRAMGVNKVPYIVTHDGRTIRYAHPAIDANDTVKFDIENNKILDFVKSEIGNICFVTSGNNIGRVGVVQHHERHPGGFDIIHVKDDNGKVFATRLSNIFVIGKGKTAWISLPENKGLWLNALEERDQRHKH